ncbi:MAG: sugar-binding transcriptional regulator [Candidatus Caldatribacteriaceae bacterium]
MSNMRASLDEDLLVRVAWLHYQEGYSQNDIADMLHLSRPKVSRLLDRAREKGIVRFFIKHPKANLLSLEKELKQTSGLQDAVVVPTGKNDEETTKNIGYGGAIYFSQNVRKWRLVGFSWGKTLRAFAQDIFPVDEVSEIRFVSLAGGLTLGAFMNPFNIGEKLALAFGGQCYYIHAPEVAESVESRNMYLTENVNRRTFEMALRAQCSLVGIGVADAEHSTYIQAGFINQQDMELIRQLGGVGDVLGQFFDIEGRVLDIELHQRTIAVSLEDFRNMPDTIGLAGGQYKVDAILGALRGRFVKILVTDEDTAYSILEKERGKLH